MIFKEKLAKSVRIFDSTLCVGLDPNLDLMPKAISQQEHTDAQKVEQFLKKVIDVTSDYCAAYKPNLGFFEALGTAGWQVFENILQYIPEEKIIIADAKRGDISSTAEHYAKAFFEREEIDAITLNPLMGYETLNPFLDHKSKGIYVLTLTSNPGSKDILLQKLESGTTVSSSIAKQLSEKQRAHDTAVGMVVGATQAKQLKPVIRQFPGAPLLIPGVGKQGGSVEALAEVLEDHQGTPLVNSSRSILYAQKEGSRWDKAVAESAENLSQKLSPITERYV